MMKDFFYLLGIIVNLVLFTIGASTVYHVMQLNSDIDALESKIKLMQTK